MMFWGVKITAFLSFGLFRHLLSPATAACGSTLFYHHTVHEITIDTYII